MWAHGRWSASRPPSTAACTSWAPEVYAPALAAILPIGGVIGGVGGGLAGDWLSRNGGRAWLTAGACLALRLRMHACMHASMQACCKHCWSAVHSSPPLLHAFTLFGKLHLAERHCCPSQVPPARTLAATTERGLWLSPTLLLRVKREPVAALQGPRSWQRRCWWPTCWRRTTTRAWRRC